MGPGRRRSVASIAAFLPIATLLGACALSTFSGDEYLTTCSFLGTNTSCGQCIAANCQTSVDACCADGACSQKEAASSSLYDDPGALKLLDRCAQGGSCNDLETHPRAQAITACIHTSCQASCDLWRKSILRPDATNCERTAGDSSPPSCRCTIPAETEGAPTTPNSATCNRRTISNGVCCASKDWPAPASTCTCKVATCQPSGESCSCSANSTYSSQGDGVNACARGGCCTRSDGQCVCGSNYCGNDTLPVDQCTPSLVGCSNGQRAVDTCSAK